MIKSRPKFQLLKRFQYFYRLYQEKGQSCCNYLFNSLQISRESQGSVVVDLFCMLVVTQGPTRCHIVHLDLISPSVRTCQTFLCHKLAHQPPHSRVQTTRTPSSYLLPPPSFPPYAWPLLAITPHPPGSCNAVASLLLSPCLKVSKL